MTQFKKEAVYRLLVIRFVVLAIIVFFCAGTLTYWQGWAFVIVFTVCNGMIMAYLWKNNPMLMARRMIVGFRAEKEKSQKIMALILSVVVKILLIFSIFDYRLQVHHISALASIGGDVLIAIGFYATFIVFRVNVFASATIEIMNNQKIIRNGPYAIVRHPMYIGSFCILFGTPLALGSYWGLLISSTLIPLFIWRLIEEEKFLGKNLPDYKRYQTDIRWRLVPGIF